MSARGHGANEDAGIEEVVGEPDPVPEHGPVTERARRIHRDDPDRPSVSTNVPDQRRDEARLPYPGWSSDPDRVGASGTPVQLLDELVGAGVAVLDERQRSCDRPPVARRDAVDERLVRQLARHQERVPVETALGSPGTPSPEPARDSPKA